MSSNKIFTGFILLALSGCSSLENTPSVEDLCNASVATISALTPIRTKMVIDDVVMVNQEVNKLNGTCNNVYLIKQNEEVTRHMVRDSLEALKEIAGRNGR